jgi:hypothetical protein
MKISFVPTLAFFVFAAITQQLRAEFIQPVAVYVQNGEATQDALINGQGFDDPGLGSPASIHSTSAAEMWSAVGSIRESATFDLGITTNLTRVYIWNYNAPNATDVGMRDVEVQVSSETDITTASAFNTIAKISLAEGGTAAQVFDVIGTRVRAVRLKSLSNWGQGFSVGLAEVRFESGSVTGNVPVITVTSPRDGDEIAFGADLLIDARVVDSDGDLQKVEYFDGDTLLTNRATAPHAVTLPQPARGEHSYRVVATDRSGKTSWVTINLNVRELVADRIVKIDDTADEGTELNQIRYQGAWTLAQGPANDPRYMQNDHYNLGGNRVDYYEVRFVGVKIDLFGTVASHHGTAWASIDGGPESRVNYKTPQRREQVLVWSSPILANREHTLRVRTAGDGVVTADRFDISVSDKPDLAAATIKSVSFNQLIVEIEDTAASFVDQATIKLTLDSALITPSIAKAGPLTTITYNPAAPFAPGSSHTLKIEAKDTAGNSLTNDLAFNLPAPFFPLTGLGSPAPTAGHWSVRQIWNAGRVDAIVSAADLAVRANQGSFTGRVHDAQEPVINFALTESPGGGGIFPDDLALPAEAVGLTPSDFVIIARADVVIPRAGDWTIGVHSDDGFALRFVGHPFESVGGAGVHDDNFPEYIGFLTETGNSNTRGILRNVPAGTYPVEFIAFQRTAGAQYEIYAAEGAFAEDTETDTWQLIGAPGGLEIVASQIPLEILQLSRTATTFLIEFQSPNPDATHQLLQSTDLQNWTPVTGVTFAKTANNRVRASISNPSGPATFFRVALP